MKTTSGTRTLGLGVALLLFCASRPATAAEVDWEERVAAVQRGMSRAEFAAMLPTDQLVWQSTTTTGGGQLEVYRIGSERWLMIRYDWTGSNKDAPAKCWRSPDNIVIMEPVLLRSKRHQ